MHGGGSPCAGRARPSGPSLRRMDAGDVKGENDGARVGEKEGAVARRTSGPLLVTWVAAVFLGGLGLLLRLQLVSVPWLGIDPFWFVTAGFVLLAAARFIKRL